MIGDERRQLRLALSMNGGVSLAVWIAGAVAEIDRVRRGDTQFWSALLSACGYEKEAQVDVLVGASAGGLNGVLMTQAIRSGWPFEDFLGLWLELADFDTLVKAPRHAVRPGADVLTNTCTDGAAGGAQQTDPREVLDGAYFRNNVYSALTTMKERLHEEGTPDLRRPGTHDLVLLASATLVTPSSLAYRDMPGAPISEGNSEAYFHVAKRGEPANGLDGFDPPGTVATNESALACIGRATSSLPGLFAPVRFDRGQFGARLVDAFGQHDAVEVIDGGILDNAPISRAIRAIYQSRANRTVRRVLMYLHPDPAVPNAPPANPVTPTALEVVKAFFDKRGETLREDVDLLRAHNAAVARRAATTTALLTTLLADAEALAATTDATDATDIPDTPGDAATIATSDAATVDEGDGVGDDAAPLIPNPDLASAIVDPGDAAGTASVDIVTSALGQVGTVDQLLRVAIAPDSEMHWHAPGTPRVAALLDSPAAGTGPHEWRVAFAGAVEQNPRLLVAERGRRVARALTIVMHQAQGSVGAEPLAAALRRLDELNLLCDLLNAYQYARLLGVRASGDLQRPEAAVARLRNSARELDQLVAAVGDATSLWNTLATWDVPPHDADAGLGLLDAGSGPVDDLLGGRVTAIIQSLEPLPGDTPAVQILNMLIAGDPADGGPSLVAGDVALRLLPLLVEPVASDQAIAFVRASGDVDTPASRSFLTPDDVDQRGGRVAGMQLAHLGAFFDRRWRVNDIRWGQLDVVPALLDALLDDTALATLRGEHGLFPPSASATEIKAQLTRRRQGQLLATFTELGESAAGEPAAGAPAGDVDDDSDIANDALPGALGPDLFEDAVSAPAFREWRAVDRRVQSLLGSRAATSTAMRMLLTAVKVFNHELKTGWKLLLHVLRPVLLVVAGLVLAGRWFTVAAAWTIGVMAAPRMGSAGGALAMWFVGLLLVVGVWLILALKIRPAYHRWYNWFPYVLAVAGLLLGLYLAIRTANAASGARLHELPWRDPDRSTALVLAGVAAFVSSGALFFWMRLGALAVTVTAITAWYTAIAWLGHSGHRIRGWQPLVAVAIIGLLAILVVRLRVNREAQIVTIAAVVALALCTALNWATNLLFAWVVAVVVSAWALGQLPDRWLRPRAARSPVATISQ